MHFIFICVHITIALLTFPTIICLGVFVSTCNAAFNTVSYMFALLATSIVLIKYVPQIWKTFKLKRAGSLSITGYIFQVPGAVVNITMLVSSENNVSNWITAICVLIMLSVLLTLLLVFENCEPWKFSNGKPKINN